MERNSNGSLGSVTESCRAERQLDNFFRLYLDRSRANAFDDPARPACSWSSPRMSYAPVRSREIPTKNGEFGDR